MDKKRVSNVQNRRITDKTVLDSVDDIATSATVTSGASTKKSKRPNHAEISNGKLITAINDRMLAAQEELHSVRQAIREPATERTAFMEWVKQVINTTTEENFSEFQNTFIAMQTKSKQASRERAVDCRNSWQPLPNQWRQPPPQMR